MKICLWGNVTWIIQRAFSSCQFFRRGCPKSVTMLYCGMDVHKSFVYACIVFANKQGVALQKKINFAFTKDLAFLYQVACGKQLQCRYCSCLNALKQSRVKRRTNEMQDGLQIFSIAILYEGVLSILRMLVYFKLTPRYVSYQK